MFIQQPSHSLQLKWNIYSHYENILRRAVKFQSFMFKQFCKHLTELIYSTKCSEIGLFLVIKLAGNVDTQS